MSKLIFATFTLALLLLVGSCVAGPSQGAPGAVMDLSGTVRLVGTATFNDLIITDDQGVDWYIVEASRAFLAGMEQGKVHVRGTFTLKTMVLADGRELPPRREFTITELVK